MEKKKKPKKLKGTKNIRMDFTTINGKTNPVPLPASRAAEQVLIYRNSSARAL